MIYIENEGALFRGASRGDPREIWHPEEKRFVPYKGAGQPKPISWGYEIDEAEAERLMNAGDGESPEPGE